MHRCLESTTRDIFFCGYGLALILWRLCFVIVPCFVGAVRGHGTVPLKPVLVSVGVACDCKD